SAKYMYASATQARPTTKIRSADAKPRKPSRNEVISGNTLDSPIDSRARRHYAPSRLESRAITCGFSQASSTSPGRAAATVNTKKLGQPNAATITPEAGPT